MITLIFANFFVFIIISAFWTFKGLDLKKRSSWLLGLYGFISGFLIGFLRSNDNGDTYYLTMNLTGSFQAGVLFAFAVLFSGATNRWHRSMGEKYLARSEKDYQEKLKNLAESLFKNKLNRK